MSASQFIIRNRCNCVFFMCVWAYYSFWCLLLSSSPTYGRNPSLGEQHRLTWRPSAENSWLASAECSHTLTNRTPTGVTLTQKNSNQENGFGSAKWILIKRRLDVIWPGKSVKLMWDPDTAALQRQAPRTHRNLQHLKMSFSILWAIPTPHDH